MPIAPLSTAPFANPGLVGLVLSDATFARRGYLWGYDGHVHYCFCNPNRLAFDVWKKRFRLWPFVISALIALVASVFAGGQLIGLVALFESLIIPLLLVKHYTGTAKEQKAAVFTNGPQMELLGNMSFETMRAVAKALLAGGTISGGVIGAAIGGTLTIGTLTVPGNILGLVVGLFSGMNALGVFLFIVGLGSTPFGSVLARGFSETVVRPNSNSYHIACSGPAFAAYSIARLNPKLAPGCGGLIAIVVNGAPASTVAIDQVAQLYVDLVGNPRPVVVWGLLPLNFEENPIFEEAIHAQQEIYGDKAPLDGLIVVAGSEAWATGDTLALIGHGVTHAAAADASQSAVLGSSGELVIGSESPFNLASYRDHVQRYGLKMVPE